MPRWAQGEDCENTLALGAIHRRTNWYSRFAPSVILLPGGSNNGHREEALSGFRRSPFFLAWDPTVLETYVEFGLGPDPEAGSKDAVRLKMTGVQVGVPARIQYRGGLVDVACCVRPGSHRVRRQTYVLRNVAAPSPAGRTHRNSVPFERERQSCVRSAVASVTYRLTDCLMPVSARAAMKQRAN